MQKTIAGSPFACPMLGLALLLSACTKGGTDAAGAAGQEKRQAIDAWNQQHGAAVQAQANHLRAIHAKALAVPSPVTASRVDAPNLLFHGTSPYKGKQVAGANAEVLAIESIQEPGTYHAPKLAAGASSAFIHGPVTVLGKKDFPPVEEGYTTDLATNLSVLNASTAKLVALEYVVLLRQTEHTPAVISGDKFVSGLYRADALVFRLSDETLVGTVRVAVKNSSQVAATYRLGQGSNADAALRSDLANGIRPVTVANVLRATK